MVLVMRRTTFDWVLRRAAPRPARGRAARGVAVAGLRPRRATGAAPPPSTGSASTTARSCPPTSWSPPPAGATRSRPGWPTRRRRGREGRPQRADVHVRAGTGCPAARSRWTPSSAATSATSSSSGCRATATRCRSPWRCGPADSDLRRVLGDPDRFEQACRLLRAPPSSSPTGRSPRSTASGPWAGCSTACAASSTTTAPRSPSGFHAVGDAHTCTNPLYGRGCSLALVQAGLLADAVAAHPDDPAARAAAYEAACRREVEPWYDLSVQTDASGSDPSGRRLGRPAQPAARGR